MLTIADVIEALNGQRPTDSGSQIRAAVHDSRQVEKESLFVALPGDRVDGHDFVDEAFTKGAVVALVQREIESRFPMLDLRKKQDLAGFQALGPVLVRVDDSLSALQQVARFWRRKLDLRVIGVTGSVGKTTSKELIAEVLGQHYRTFKSIGNYNNEIGLPLNILGIHEKHERAVLEMGFYVLGEIELLAEIAIPQIGVVTNIGTVHAERAGSQEAIYQGKAELVRSLPKDGVAVLNYDDLLVRKMADETPADVFFYGLDPQADLWADEVDGLGLDGVRFRLHYQSEVLHVRIPMIGRHSVHTALRATAVGLIEGLDWQEILSGLRIGNPQLRLVAVRGRAGAILLDDTYNASPESTVAALNLLDELEGRRIAVLGDMLELGQYELQGHAMVGNLAARVANLLVTVGDRARMIADAARHAGLKSDAILEFDDSDEALDFLKGELTGEDVVLVKGSRGMRMDAIVPGLEEKL